MTYSKEKTIPVSSAKRHWPVDGHLAKLRLRDSLISVQSPSTMVKTPTAVIHIPDWPRSVSCIINMEHLSQLDIAKYPRLRVAQMILKHAIVLPDIYIVASRNWHIFKARVRTDNLQLNLHVGEHDWEYFAKKWPVYGVQLLPRVTEMLEDGVYGVAQVYREQFDAIPPDMVISGSDIKTKYLCANELETTHLQMLGIKTDVVCDYYRIELHPADVAYLTETFHDL